MRSIRVIPCLDIHEGRVVKGVNFVGLRDAGDPVELATRYAEEGADELVFLDITATHEGRAAVIDLAYRVADVLFIPFTVGGGLRSVEDIRLALLAGADKVSLNSAALANPSLIAEASDRCGSQCVVVAIDARRSGDRYEVVTHGGRKATGVDVVDWAKQAEQLGAGEILLTSMNRDGVQTGYDLEVTRLVADSVGIPVIASGGAGSAQDVVDAVKIGHADAALVASIVHDRLVSIAEIKETMREAGLPVRILNRNAAQT